VYKDLYKDSGLDNHFTYLRNYISFSNQIQRASAQIYPRLAESVYFLYDQSVVTNSHSSLPAHIYTCQASILRTACSWVLPGKAAISLP
jgi:hypothetical protein